MRPLTEPQAWRHIAKKIEKGDWRGVGLCWEITSLYYTQRIGRRVRDAMDDRMGKHLDREPHSFARWQFEPHDDRDLPRTNGGYYETTWRSYCPDVWLAPPGLRTVRIMACELLALEAEEEGL